MYDTTMNDYSTLMIPLQAEPIDRTPAGAAAFTSETGVEASDIWGDLGNLAIQHAPDIIKTIGSWI